MKHLWELSPNKFLLLTGLLVAIVLLVFVLQMKSYWVLEFAWSLALSVCAVLKELLTIGGVVELIHERISFWTLRDS